MTYQKRIEALREKARDSRRYAASAISQDGQEPQLLFDEALAYELAADTLERLAEHEEAE